MTTLEIKRIAMRMALVGHVCDPPTTYQPQMLYLEGLTEGDWHTLVCIECGLKTRISHKAILASRLG